MPRLDRAEVSCNLPYLGWSTRHFDLLVDLNTRAEPFPNNSTIVMISGSVRMSLSSGSTRLDRQCSAKLMNGKLIRKG
jgi:hypothetical protein